MLIRALFLRLRAVVLRLRGLRRDTSGLSLIEFALILPVLTTLGFYGMEIAWQTITGLHVSQTALSAADNASRMEQTNNTGIVPTVTESDVNAVLAGAVRQATGLNIATSGKLILSSVEQNAQGQSYIHWQRCTGAYPAASAYGVEGTVLPTGIGNSAARITAPANTAVMFVEFWYRQPGLFGTMFMQPMLFHQEGAFLVRDDRNLAAGLSGTKTATC